MQCYLKKKVFHVIGHIPAFRQRGQSLKLRTFLSPCSGLWQRTHGGASLDFGSQEGWFPACHLNVCFLLNCKCPFQCPVILLPFWWSPGMHCTQCNSWALHLLYGSTLYTLYCPGHQEKRTPTASLSAAFSPEIMFEYK